MNIKFTSYSQNYTPSFGDRPARVFKEDIERLQAQKMSNAEMAKELNISYGWLKELKKRFGLIRTKSKMTDEQIKQEILKGTPDKEIAQKGHVSVRHVGDIRRAMGKKYEFRKKPTNPNIIETIKTMWMEGKSIKEIAQAVGKSQSRVSIILKEICPNLNPRKEKLIQQFKEMLASGASFPEIAKAFGKSLSWVYCMKKKI